MTLARMRSIKPEFWADEDMAGLPRDARLLYIGLWNLADEHARLRGDPRYVKGQLFPYDDDLSPAAVETLLNVLAVAGRLVRYRVGGGQYLFLPKLAKHQRLDGDKVPSRLPSPEQADPHPSTPESLTNLDSSGPDPDSSGKFADESGPDPNTSPPGTTLSVLKHVAGGMEHVAGVPPSAGTLAPRNEPTAQTIVAEWIDRCPKKPPGNVVGQMAKHLKAMLGEGIDPDDIRRGLAHWMTKGLHPSTLPSIVNEVMNTMPARASPRATTDQRVEQARAAGAEVQAMIEGRVDERA